jgi:hypothetical protein
VAVTGAAAAKARAWRRSGQRCPLRACFCATILVAASRKEFAVALSCCRTVSTSGLECIAIWNCKKRTVGKVRQWERPVTGSGPHRQHNSVREGYLNVPQDVEGWRAAGPDESQRVPPRTCSPLATRFGEGVRCPGWSGRAQTAAPGRLPPGPPPYHASAFEPSVPGRGPAYAKPV